MQVKEHNKKQFVKGDPIKTEELVKKQMKEGSKLIKGRFEFTDAQGGFIEFNWRWFKNDPLLTFKLFHGEETELPMIVVKHLNNTYKKIRFIDPNIDKNGTKRGVPSTYERISRVKFIPTEFVYG